MRCARAAVPTILLSLPALGGCVSPAVAVASYAADGASYAATGKSVSDHGLSMAQSRDCATWHFFVGRAVCEDPNDPVPTAPLDEHRRNGSIKHADGFTHRSPATYVAIGSFADRANAERLARRYTAYRPRIIGATVAGKDLHRVVLGPLDATQRAALRAEGVDGFPVAAPGRAGDPEIRQARALAPTG